MKLIMIYNMFNIIVIHLIPILFILSHYPMILYKLSFKKILKIKSLHNGHWDTHVKDFVIAGKHKINSLLRISQNLCLSLYIC